MRPSFLFTAINKDGKTVSERVSADNLAAAKYKLEIQGYSNIEFYNSELTNDVEKLFSEKQQEIYAKVSPQKQIFPLYKAGIWYLLFKFAQTIFVVFSLTIILTVLFKIKFPALVFFGISATIAYFSTPPLIYQLFITAHFWADSKMVKFWGKIAMAFNLVTINRIPQFQIETRMACADAREGNLNAALMSLKKYENNPKVTGRLMNSSLGSVYAAAKRYDEVLKVREKSLREGNIFPEELLDYAVTLAIHFKKTSQAREAVERAMNMELSVLTKAFLPFCQGIIEVEDENFAKAEFYLREATKRLKPFEKNSLLIGSRSLIKTFLAISLGKQGNKEESEKLFEEAKPYLLAHKETDLLQRCEEAIS